MTQSTIIISRTSMSMLCLDASVPSCQVSSQSVNQSIHQSINQLINKSQSDYCTQSNQYLLTRPQYSFESFPPPSTRSSPYERRQARRRCSRGARHPYITTAYTFNRSRPTRRREPLTYPLPPRQLRPAWPFITYTARRRDIPSHQHGRLE